jgi:putative ABC transport system substrate-binding protein
MSAEPTQQLGASRRIGFLGPPASPVLGVLRKALADRGYVEGRNIVIDSRWAEGGRLDQLPAAAAALVGLDVDVIVAIGGTAARAAKGATADIPIVFEIVIDPVATGLVPSWERPGGNVTGVTSFDPQQARQQLETLKEAIPGLAHVALLGDAGAAPTLFQANDNAARAMGLRTLTLKVERAPNPDFEGAFEAAKEKGAAAVVVLSTPVTSPNRRRIAELAARHRLPSLSPIDHSDAGGLICFGTSFSEITRRAAPYVEKIFRGTAPGDLPVEMVARHELVINLKTARALGVVVPPVMLSRANRVIR